MTETVRPLNLALVVRDIDSARPVSVTDILVGQGKPAFTIGSHEKSSLRIADPEVAAAHAVVTLNDGEYWIAPRFSQNEVLVNNVRIKRPTRLAADSLIQLGGYTIGVETASVPELSASASGDTMTEMVRDSGRRASSLEATADNTQVFYPKQPPPGRSRGSMAAVALLVAVVVGVGAFTLYTQVIQPASVPVVVGNPFAYNDGNVTLLMFDRVPCRQCADQKDFLQDVADQFRGDVYINYADVDIPGNEFLIMEYNVTTVPTIVVLDDQGEPVAGFAGLTDVATLHQVVAAALKISETTDILNREPANPS